MKKFALELFEELKEELQKTIKQESKDFFEELKNELLESVNLIGGALEIEPMARGEKLCLKIRIGNKEQFIDLEERLLYFLKEDGETDSELEQIRIEEAIETVNIFERMIITIKRGAKI